MRRRFALAFVFALLGAGCGETTHSSAPVASANGSATPAAATELTILYTSDEHGWLAPFVEGGKSWGGAAEVMEAWRKNEGHCAPTCATSPTIAVSGGDNFTGPALSTYFSGEPMADAFAAMHYEVSAFGNHEFDFGQAQFAKLEERSHVQYLAANMVAKDPARARSGEVKPFAIIERAGVRIAFVGLVTDKTLSEAMASGFDGFTIEKEEPALARAVALAKREKPDAVVLVAHECPDRLAPIVAAHPEYQLAIALAGHCHRVIDVKAGEVRMISPGWRFQHYVRVKLGLDPSKSAGARVTKVDASVVDVSSDANAPPRPGDPSLVAARDAWTSKLDAALGETIGFTASGFEKESPELVRWIGDAWRIEQRTDLALVNSHGIRQGLAKGAITKASVWSILPFMNKLVIVSIKGRDVLVDLKNDEARFVGLAKKGEQYFIADKPLELEKSYSLATIDYLYLGGSGFELKAQDPHAKETGIDWREPIITWTQRAKTAAGDPLERHLP